MRIPSFIRNRDGASIIEFAIVAPVFFLLIMGIIEFGLFMFHKVVIESITMQVGREASLNTTSGTSTSCSTGNDRFAYIRCYVREKSQGLINSDQIQVNINTVAQGGTRSYDICMTNPPSSPAVCPAGVGFEDANNNGVYDAPQTNNSAGAAGDLIEVRVSYPWHVLVPFMSSLIGSTQQNGTRTGVVMITSSTVFRNEPQ